MSENSDRNDAMLLQRRIRGLDLEQLVTLRQWTAEILNPHEIKVMDEAMRRLSGGAVVTRNLGAVA